MPKEVEVVIQRDGRYAVCVYNGAGVDRYFAGNQEQVHSWLAQHGYKQQNTVLQGTYRREGLGCAS